MPHSTPTHISKDKSVFQAISVTAGDGCRTPISCKSKGKSKDVSDLLNYFYHSIQQNKPHLQSYPDHIVFGPLPHGLISCVNKATNFVLFF